MTRSADELGHRGGNCCAGAWAAGSSRPLLRRQLACAACCVLPFAFPAVAMAGAGSVIAWLVGAQSWMMNFAFIAVAGGWIWVAWQSFRHKAKPAMSTLGAMGAAILLLGLAAVWPTVEPIVIELLLL